MGSAGRPPDRLVTRAAAPRPPVGSGPAARDSAGLGDDTGDALDVLLISHFHWDREWYRTFQAFRARLIDAVDLVLDLLDTDPGYRFVLDGQSIVLDDYLAVRPGMRAAIERGVREGRLGVGPWFVQPDALLPSGEAHVRNLLTGRAAAAPFGPVSRVAYVPDAFGHPAAFPMIFAGFGLTDFVYWRGNGDEIDALGPVWRWVAPDAGAVVAHFLAEGYFCASGLDADAEAAAERLADLTAKLAAPGRRGPVLLMNGFDHALPDPNTGEVAEALAVRTGGKVTRALLDDVIGTADAATLPSHAGELLGGRVANLLPGVWSTRMPLKLANRRCETALEAWAEPWAALGRVLGLPDERPALRRAWRDLLKNQAHDSIGGCSVDPVHERMESRYSDALGLATETTDRVLAQLAGRGVARRTPWSETQDVVVYNPSPHTRTDIVRVPLDSEPQWTDSIGRFDIHPLALAALGVPGFTVDGAPARVVPADDPTRVRFLPDQPALDLEFVAREVPAFGCLRYGIAPCDPVPDEVDDGRDISAGDVSVHARGDGTLDVVIGGREYSGLLGIEDEGDRGDSYDFDPVGDAGPPELLAVYCLRARHPSGIQSLTITRILRVPGALDDARDARCGPHVEMLLTVEARVALGTGRVDLAVSLDHRACDHRLRLAFPTGAPCDRFAAASTFGVAERPTTLPDASRWVHPAVATFPHQGWVQANGLTVVAPGLPEAEVTPDGVILLTLVRATGWLSRFDLHSRPVPAGPVMEAPAAQVQQTVTATLSMLAGSTADPVAARDAETGLRGVLGGSSPMLDAGRSLLALEPRSLVLSALKPAEPASAAGVGAPDDDRDVIVRVLNPTGDALTARLATGFPPAAAFASRLDESADTFPVALERTPGGATVVFDVPPFALRTVRLRPTAG